MKGTEKQVAWAEDIKKQVMDAAQEIYEDSEDKKWGLTLEQTVYGHSAVFACEHCDDAKFWINAVGYNITDYQKRSESAKCVADLKGILRNIVRKLYMCGCDLPDQFYAEEDELGPIRIEKRNAAWAARKAAKAAKRAAARAAQN